jgi:isoquinoline 1-oxidoreductase beta subunit
VAYAFDYALIDFVDTPTHVPTGAWRSVGHSQNAFVIESFIDELAYAMQQDPYRFRLGLLKDKPRHKAVLQLAAEKAGWGNPLPDSRFRGIALHASFDSYVAQVAEVSINKNQGVRVHRVVCAIDCGIVINPDTVAAQMESGIVFGLTATLKGKIDINAGAVVQSNFHDFPLLTIGEMPDVETYIVPSTEPPGGVGEPGVPPIAPAVANAVFAATGKRVYTLPIILTV